MIKTSFEHKTPSSKIIINIKAINLLKSNLNRFVNKNLFNELCKKGCPNYNHKWSCPPYSPIFDKYVSDYSNVLIVLMYCYLDQFSYIKTEYMKVKASNSILKSSLDNLMRKLEIKYKGLMLSNGSCRLCKPCNCKKKLPCKKATIKRYSMEAVGLNVSDISKEYFNHELLWYKNKKAPLYASVVSCVFTNDLIVEDKLLNLFK